MKLINIKKLNSMFSGSRTGQGDFPELIKKLIIASVNSCKTPRFPSGDAIWNAGFDGIISDVKAGDRFVPEGDSYWETGTNADPFAKCKSDFNKRPADVNKTFVFCTPFIWTNVNNVEKWKAQKKALNTWKDIILIDGALLQDWLEMHIEVSIWLLEKFGELTGDGIKLLEHECKRLCEITNPKMSVDFFTCSNSKNIDLLNEKLLALKPSAMVTIKSDKSFQEGYMFTIGALIKKNDANINARTIVVKNKEALEFVKLNYKGKIVILYANCEDEDLLTSENIFIYITVNKAKNADVVLEPKRFQDFNDCLKNMGIETTRTSTETALLNRNILCFKRKYAVQDNIRIPAWAKNGAASDITALALVTKFNPQLKGDCEVVEQLSGKKVSEYVEILDNWLKVDDTPIFKLENTYCVHSKEEALSALQISVDSIKVKTLQEILASVLKEPNPKYKKDPSRWDFNSYEDEKPKYSNSLVRGVIDSFAILLQEESREINSLVARIISEIKDIEISVFTLFDYLTNLSEVSYSAVLDYIENAIDRDCPTFRKVVEQQYGMMFKSTHMHKVVWTLHHCLRRADSCIQALRIYLKLHYSNYALPSNTRFYDDVGVCIQLSTFFNVTGIYFNQLRFLT